MRFWQLGALGATASALFLIALFPPWSIAFLAPVALAPLLYALCHTNSWKHRFLTGWLAGFLFWIFTCSWIGDTLARYGGLNTALSILALFLFAVVKGLHLAVFSTLAGLVLKRPWAVPAVAALWTGIERTHGPFGFAWLTLGNAGIDMGVPLRLAPVVGVYGLSFVLAAMSAAVTMLVYRRSRREFLWLAPLVLLYLLPSVELKVTPREQAAALQTNVAGDASWSAEETRRTLNQFSLLSLQETLDPSKPKPSLLLWPEAPAPLYYYDDPAFRTLATETARLAATPFLFGGVARTPGGAPLNSAVFLSPQGRLQGRYDKRYLVPFGEFIPPAFGWIEKVSSEAGNYAPGQSLGLFNTGSHLAGVFICYEAAFPHLVRESAAAGASVLVNISNDGYFGRTAARRQHLLLARMRAVENRRWLLRATNDGITASIDPSGRVWDRLPEFKRTSGRLRFDYVDSKSPYSTHGDWFAWSCLALGLALAALAWLPRYTPPAPSPEP